MENNEFINNIKSILDKTNNKNIMSLYNNMSSYQKRIFDSWNDNIDSFINYSFNDLVFDFDAEFVQNILELELDLYLKENTSNGKYNKRNGYTKDITITTPTKQIEINRPRLRNEKDFDSIFVPKRTRIMKYISNDVLLLYSKNNSINEIKDILSSMFGIKISTGKISNLIQDISYNVLEWRNRKLNKCYFTINIDCTYISIRDNKDINSHKVPIYVAVGTTLLGYKEILGIYLGNEDENKNLIDELHTDDIAEATSYWINIFEDLKERGVEKILYAVSDGLSGIENAIKTAFPDTFYQRCIVHIVRNLKTYTNKKNCASIIKDFKSIYTAENKELALENYNEFKDKYQNNKNVIKHAEEYINYIMPLFDLPVYIRKYIYTNNIAESVNSKIKRGFYGRGALPNINSALNIVFLNLDDLENKWKKQKVSNWNNIFNEINTIHKDIIKKYLD